MGLKDARGGGLEVVDRLCHKIPNCRCSQLVYENANWTSCQMTGTATGGRSTRACEANSWYAGLDEGQRKIAFVFRPFAPENA